MTTEHNDYLLDTNACIAIRELIKELKPKDPQRADKLAKLKIRWSAIPKERLFMSIISWGELRYGAEKSTNPTSANAHLAKLRQTLQILHMDDSTGEHYGAIRSHLEQKGQTIGPNDLWIAAHGRAKNCKVITNNMGEFGRVPQLQCEDWTA
jgi:tRNA(fMet)-specific endonuclease VapC